MPARQVVRRLTNAELPKPVAPCVRSRPAPGTPNVAVPTGSYSLRRGRTGEEFQHGCPVGAPVGVDGARRRTEIRHRQRGEIQPATPEAAPLHLPETLVMPANQKAAQLPPLRNHFGPVSTSPTFAANTHQVANRTLTVVQLHLQRATELMHDGAKLRNPTDATLHAPTDLRHKVVDMITGQRAKRPRHHPMPPTQHHKR